MQKTRNTPDEKERHRQFQLYMSIDNYFAEHGYEPDALLNTHRQHMATGGWPSFVYGFNVRPFQYVSQDELFDLLYNPSTDKLVAAFNVILEPKEQGAKLTDGQITEIRNWFAKYSLDKAFFVNKHQSLLLAGRDWGEGNPLNDLSVTDLGLALFYGYQRVDTPEDK